MKKIMFNDQCGLTTAVLEGRKTMTRRLVPEGTPFGNWEETLKKSRYQVGEIVAVAQNLRDMGYNPRDTKHKPGEIWGLDHSPAWTNKMFVSASECIHQIRITNIHVERLQDISEEDILREGIEKDGDIYSFNDYEGYKTPQLAFKALINRISGKGTWERNPWVFVYEFELIK